MIYTLSSVMSVNSELVCSEFSRFTVACSKSGPVAFSNSQFEVCLSFGLKYLTACSSWYAASAISLLDALLIHMSDYKSLCHVRVIWTRSGVKYTSETEYSQDSPKR